MRTYSGKLGVCALCAVSLLLAACGGGGGGGTPGAVQVNFQTPALNSQATYAVTGINGLAGAFNYTYRKTHNVVNADGSFQATMSCLSSTPANNVDYCLSGLIETDDATGHMQTQVIGANPVCAFSPVGEGRPFPLSVGKSWSTNWTESCGGVLAFSFALTNGVVTGNESITVTAGTFNTMVVMYTIVWTPTGGGLPTVTMTRTVWIDIQTGGTVRTTTNYSYNVGPVGTSVVQVTQELQSYTGPTPGDAIKQ